MYPRYDHMDGWGDGRWIAMLVFMVVVIGLVTALVVWLLRTTGGPGKVSAPPPTSAATSSAEQILAERFARGEIDEEEFTRRRALLRAGPGA